MTQKDLSIRLKRLDTEQFKRCLDFMDEMGDCLDGWHATDTRSNKRPEYTYSGGAYRTTREVGDTTLKDEPVYEDDSMDTEDSTLEVPDQAELTLDFGAIMTDPDESYSGDETQSEPQTRSSWL